MAEELWIDGFNLFHQWSRTREAFRPGGDIASAQEHALRTLARALDRAAPRTVVFMDGGPERTAFTVGRMRVRYPGPGAKADDLMVERLQAKRAGQVRAVTDDRLLRDTLRARGAKTVGVEAFIRDRLATPGTSRGADERPEEREKHRELTPDEVEAWVREFEGEEPDPHA